METISLKMDDTMLNAIDTTLKKHRYATRTEFIRDAIRKHLTDLEKEEAISRIAKLRGVFKDQPVSEKRYREVREQVFSELAKKHNIKLE